MTRQRARPSFTVEIKRNRNTSLSLHEDPDRPRAAQTLWHGTPLAEAPPRPHVLEAAFARPEVRPKPVESKPAPNTPARRVLPSLIQPVAADPEPALPEPEPPIAPKARVARPAAPAKPRRKPTPPAPASFAAEAPTPVVAPPATSVRSAPRAPDEGSAEEPSRRYTRRAAPVLKAGERWKRRLPRACW